MAALPFVIVGLLSFFLPLTFDEAYYLSWSRQLSWGFFDHPPAVAAVALLRRFGPALLALLTGIVFMMSARTLYRNDGAAQKTAALLFLFSFGFILNGILITPDIPLSFFWMTSLFLLLLPRKSNFVFAALGISMGFGVLSKYTFALFGAPFVAAWFKEKWSIKKVLVVSLFFFVTLAPHLSWLANHDFITFRFQLRHGFQGAHQKNVEAGYPLPVPGNLVMLPVQASFAFQKFDEKKAFKFDKAKPPETFADKLGKSVQRFFDFVGGQVLILGFLGIYIIVLILLKLKRKERFAWKRDPVLATAALTPLVFFGLLSPFTKIEANWPAMWLPAFALLAAPEFSRKTSGLTKVAFIQSLVLLGVCSVFVASKVFSINLPKNRLTSETVGYDLIAPYLPSKKILADTYQLASMLGEFDRSLIVGQFPHWNRDSQWTLDAPPFESFLDEKKFHVITSESHVPFLQEFRLESLVQLRLCNAKKIQPVTLDDAAENVCKDPIARYLVGTYKPL